MCFEIITETALSFLLSPFRHNLSQTPPLSFLPLFPFRSSSCSMVLDYRTVSTVHAILYYNVRAYLLFSYSLLLSSFFRSLQFYLIFISSSYPSIYLFIYLSFRITINLFIYYSPSRYILNYYFF